MHLLTRCSQLITRLDIAFGNPVTMINFCQKRSKIQPVKGQLKWAGPSCGRGKEQRTGCDLIGQAEHDILFVFW